MKQYDVVQSHASMAKETGVGDFMSDVHEELNDVSAPPAVLARRVSQSSTTSATPSHESDVFA